MQFIPWVAGSLPSAWNSVRLRQGLKSSSLGCRGRNKWVNWGERRQNRCKICSQRRDCRGLSPSLLGYLRLSTLHARASRRRSRGLPRHLLPVLTHPLFTNSRLFLQALCRDSAAESLSVSLLKAEPYRAWSLVPRLSAPSFCFWNLTRRGSGLEGASFLFGC